ncbi:MULTISPECIES: DUF4209 domain-containing protein [unclassified Psychrobacter]|uniref:DUF4209 domain-containing protein n=1 Tax=unclassified Psychrobacter TaxID=196806 RepID=UPI001868061E|nr:MULTISPECIES: DUF4209 domain-containing protein [unclassified Psychrobacter]
MKLPDIYMREASKVNSFHDIFSLKAYLWDNPNDEIQQKYIDFEKSVFLLSDLTQGELTLRETNLIELKSYIHTKLNIDNRYLNLLYNIAYINLKIKLKEFKDRPSDMLNVWFEEFNELSNDYRPNDRTNSIASLLNTYLILSKRVCGKKFDENLAKAYAFIINFDKNPEPFTNFCNEQLLSFFSTGERKAILSHFFESLKQDVENLTDNEKSDIFLSDSYLFVCLGKIIDHSVNNGFDDLKYEVTNYLISNTLDHLERTDANPLIKYSKLQYCLKISGFHNNKEKIKNIILLKIIGASTETHNDMASNIETFEQKLSKSYQDSLNQQIQVYEKYGAIDCLSHMSGVFFSSAESILKNSNSNTFHFTMLASQLLIDESGLIRGIVNDDESRLFQDLKQNISFFVQINLPLFHSIREKNSFEEDLLKIEVFNTNDDKHIRNAIRNFLEEDYHGFVSRSVPLIEKKLRLLLRSLGEADISPNSIGGFDFRPMNAFMSSQVIADVFTEPVRLMFKVLYDDRRGFNLRNKIAHGIVEADEINFFQALLVLFTIVYLSTVIIEKTD